MHHSVVSHASTETELRKHGHHCRTLVYHLNHLSSTNIDLHHLWIIILSVFEDLEEFEGFFAMSVSSKAEF